MGSADLPSADADRGHFGMNFKYMPELNWHYGYSASIVAIVASAVLPILI